MRSDSLWTSERVELLTQMWGEGRTAAVIAARLGGLSRSAVLGKVFRLRLGADAPLAPASVNADAAAAQQTSNKAKQTLGALPGSPAPSSLIRMPLARRRRSGKRAKPAIAAPATKSAHKTLLELTNDSCRWPHGRPGTEKFFFCGAPGADVDHGIPYCARHMRRAYVPAEETKTGDESVSALQRAFAFAAAPRKPGAHRLGR